MDGYSPLIVKDSSVFILDQKQLPGKVNYFEANTVDDVCFAIKEMLVRGAPLIGITAAFGLFLAAKDADTIESLKEQLKLASECLAKTRPTAVNLFFAINRINGIVNYNMNVVDIVGKIKKEAFSVWDEQKESDLLIGKHGAEFLKGKRNVLTHCNTGTLATGGIGTALGIVKTMHKQGSLDTVFVDETRPYLQGMRLTAFELEKEGINYKIVTDNSCGILMKKGLVDAVVVGADRIAKNGDTANKIGTYCLASMAKIHNLPFIVAAPESTIDRMIESMDDIVVEERAKEEVLKIGDFYLSPENADALHLSFDLTDANLISAIITEKNVYERFGF